ncbi:MAG: YceD family protein [Flavobacteriales bacterium]
MKALKEYQIPFLGLKVGTHSYEFTLTEAFFEAFEYSEITESNIAVELEFEKQGTLMVLDFELKGSVTLLCDRCGDPYSQIIQSNERLIVKFGDETGHTDEDILVLGPSENTVDVSQYLYEYAHLALPAKHVHAAEAECNQEVLAAYKKYTVDSDNRDEWAALKNLQFEDNEPLEDDEEE